MGPRGLSCPVYSAKVILFVMAQLTLMRKPYVFINGIIQIIFSGLWVAAGYRGKSYLFWIWATALVLLLLKNGNKIEYFPNETAKKRLGIVRTFLDNIPGIPPVCKMTCEKNE